MLCLSRTPEIPFIIVLSHHCNRRLVTKRAAGVHVPAGQASAGTGKPLARSKTTNLHPRAALVFEVIGEKQAPLLGTTTTETPF